MLEGRIVPAGLNQSLDVIDQGFGGMYDSDFFLQGGQGAGMEQRCQLFGLVALAAGSEQGAFGGAIRVAEFDAHQEAVKL